MKCLEQSWKRNGDMIQSWLLTESGQWDVEIYGSQS